MKTLATAAHLARHEFASRVRRTGALTPGGAAEYSRRLVPTGGAHLTQGEITVHRWIGRLMACAVGALVIASCSSGESAGDVGVDATNVPVVETSVPLETPSTVPEETAATVAPDDPLEQLLVTSVPEGFAQVDDELGDTGPSDLAKAIRDDGEPDAEQVLTDAGFVRGYQRFWETEDQSGLIIVFLYEFSDPDGAAAYAERALQLTEGNAAVAPVEFDVEGIPGAVGRTLSDETGVSSFIVFTSSNYLVQIAVVDTEEAASQGLAQQLSVDQFARL